MVRRWKAWRTGAFFNPSAPAAKRTTIVVWGPSMGWFDARARASCLFGCSQDQVGLRELTGSTLAPGKLWQRLGELLEEANVVVTFDEKRNITLPCFFCGTTEAPRKLVAVGSNVQQTATGSFVRTGALSRPVCGECACAILLLTAPHERRSTT